MGAVMDGGNAHSRTKNEQYTAADPNRLVLASTVAACVGVPRGSAPLPVPSREARTLA